MMGVCVLVLLPSLYALHGNDAALVVCVARPF